jgi:hypothetical protein
MKVKAIDIYGHEAEAVERELQAWLRENPNASIEHVVHAPMPIAGTVRHLVMTIIYRD